MKYKTLQDYIKWSNHYLKVINNNNNNSKHLAPELGKQQLVFKQYMYKDKFKWHLNLTGNFYAFIFK